MARKWYKTQYPGVRFREHPERKFNGKPDRYFTIRYRIGGNLKEEGIGWSSENWNAKKASILRSNLISGHVDGEGPATLGEKRILAEKKTEAQRLEKERLESEALTFGRFFKDAYYPQAKANKTQRTYTREEMLFRLWIEPIIGPLPFPDISPVHLEKIKENMFNGSLSARSVRYALAIIRQVFNQARYTNVFIGESPIKHVKMPQADNKRLRFLSHDEAEKLLQEIRKRSQDLYEISLISLKTGARAGEILALKWGDVNLQRGTLTLWDTKNTKTRIVFMTKDVKKMFRVKETGEPEDLVFPRRDGSKRTTISNSFSRAVDAVGLNSNVVDNRMKVVFHTLRHTYASWLVESGESLYTVKELMGHSTLAMTERYSHIGNNTLQNAVRKLEKIDLSGKHKDDAEN